MGSFTVFYDGQFWVGVAERERAGAYEIARVVFGPGEPRDVDLVAWARDEFHRLSFRGVAVEGARDERPPGNPKRRQREAARALAAPGPSTKAQRALAAAREAVAVERAHHRRQHHRDAREAAWEQRRARKKKRRRGH